LHVVIVGPPSQGVEVHEVLKIADVPFLSETQRGDKTNVFDSLQRPNPQPQQQTLAPW
jgi:hypothetical protein